MVGMTCHPLLLRKEMAGCDCWNMVTYCKKNSSNHMNLFCKKMGDKSLAGIALLEICIEN
jgi:hypothetical protein